MEYIDYKPLGTIVKVRGMNKKFMIVQRATITSLKEGDPKRFFDYGCVLYPEGLIKNQLIYFQDTDIEKVLFEGYSDEDNIKALDRLKEIMKKLNIERESTDAIKNSFEYPQNTEQDIK